MTMTQIKQQFDTVMKSKSFKEFFQNVPWGFIRLMAAFPAILFISSMFMMLIKFLFFLPNYMSVTSVLNTIAAVMGSITIILYFGKKSCEGKKPLSLIKDNKPVIFFIFLILLMVISTFYNGFTDFALHGDSYRGESLFTFIIYFVIYFFCTSIAESQKLKKFICYLYLSIAFVICVTVLLHVAAEALSINWLYNLTITLSNEFGLNGIYKHFNHYAYHLVIGIVLSSSLFINEKAKPVRAFCMLCFVLFNITLIINDTFGCYLASFIALVFNVIVLYIINKKINIAALVMIGVFVLISVVMSFWYTTVFSNVFELFVDVKRVATNDDPDSAGHTRWYIWRNTFDYIKESPVFGHGIEGIGERLYAIIETTRPHNEFLQYAAFFGIPSMIVYICGVFSVFINGLKNKLRLDIYTLTALVVSFGYLVSSFFGNTMHYTAPLFFIFLGMANMPLAKTKTEEQV